MLYAFYTSLLLLLTFFSFLFIDQNFFPLKNLYTGFATANRPEVSLTFLSIIVSFFIFYFSILLSIHKKLIKPKEFKKFLLTAVIILAFSYPAMTSSDIFNYIATAKVSFFYFENPYLLMPIEFVGDPTLSFTHAANKIALYGPFWIALTSIPFILSFGNYIAGIFLFKLMIVLFYLGSVFLIFRMTKNLFAVSLFALNPLVILETLVSSHNDIVMMFFALLSFYFLKNKKIILSLISILLSILIKYATVFLIPILIYVFWKNFKGEEVDWNKIFSYSLISMFAIFLLSFLREEIYPWYGIWFLSFLPFVYRSKFFLLISLAFSFGLILRYIPFMLTGTHFGLSPAIKTFVTFAPPFLATLFVWRKKLWANL